MDSGVSPALTRVERTSERELVVSRTFKAPPGLVFEAWSRPEWLMQWWTPKSFGIEFVSCEADVRTGGSYRFVFAHPSSDQPMAFFGRYLEVIPSARLVWTNEEGGESGAVTTVTFDAHEGGTRLVLRELYPTKSALDEAMATDSACGYDETFRQLDALDLG